MVLRRNIFFDEGKEIADQNDFLFLETSAKTGDNVEEVSLLFARLMILFQNKIIKVFLRASYEIYRKITVFSKEVNMINYIEKREKF